MSEEILSLCQTAQKEKDPDQRVALYTHARTLLNHGVPYPKHKLFSELRLPNLIDLVTPEMIDFIAYLGKDDYSRRYDFGSYVPGCYLSYLLLASKQLQNVFQIRPSYQSEEWMIEMALTAAKFSDYNAIELLLCLGFNLSDLSKEKAEEAGLLPWRTRLEALSEKPIMRKELKEKLLRMDLPDLMYLYLIRDRKIAANSSRWTKYYSDFERVILPREFWIERIEREFPGVPLEDIPVKDWYGYASYVYLSRRLLPKLRLHDNQGHLHTLALYFYEGRGFLYTWFCTGKKLDLLEGDFQSYVNGTNDLIGRDDEWYAPPSKKYSLALSNESKEKYRVQFDDHHFLEGCMLYCQMAGLSIAETISDIHHYTY